MANFVKLYVEEITDAEDHIQGGSRDEDVLRCTETVRIGKGGMLQDVCFDPALGQGETDSNPTKSFPASALTQDSSKIRIHQLCESQEKSNAPSGRGGSRIAIVDNFLYVFGGADRIGAHFNDLWRCDIGKSNSAIEQPENDENGPTWELLDGVAGEPPEARSGHAFVSIGSARVLMFGGMSGMAEGSGGRGVLDDTTLLQVGSEQEAMAWHVPKIRGSRPRARTEHSATRIDDNAVLIYGGSSPEIGCFGDIHIATCTGVSQVTWALIKTSGSPPIPREMHGTCFLPGKETEEKFIFSTYDGDLSSLPENQERCTPTESAREEAEKFRAEGNRCFKCGDFQKAVTAYSKGILVDPTSSLLASNRSAAYNCLKEYDSAVLDARRTISLRPNWAKGHYRECIALEGLKEYPPALNAVERAMEAAVSDEEVASFLAVRQRLEMKDPQGRRFCDQFQRLPSQSRPALLVYGGRSADNTILDDVWCFDLKSQEWYKTAETGIPRCGHAVVKVEVDNERQMLVHGGWSGIQDIHNSLLLYCPFTNNWRQTEQTVANAAEVALPPERFSHAYTQTTLGSKNIRVFYFGGVNIDADLSDLFEVQLE